MQLIVDFFFRVAPLLAALGLFHMAAASARALWMRVKLKAGSTPTKIDDFLIHVADPPVQAALLLLDAGDIEGAKKKITAIREMTRAK